MTSLMTLPNKLPRTFDELHRLLSLRPIRDEVGFSNAQEVADALAVLDRRTRDQEDYLGTLATLMEEYERERHAVCPSGVTPLQTLKFLLEEHGMSGSDLGRLLGQRTLGAAILSGRRELSKAHIRKLREYFKVGVEAFL
ncbi:transcriptional regulator [bacterium]|nr:transcriptional regulator [bacterium]